MTKRRLAAIVVIDVVGYSRLMAADEEGTLAALKAHRNETDPIVLNHGGRIVKGTGDGVLVEFPSAVEAVRAAVETQSLMADRNAAAPEGRRMEYRIGINLGDVIVDDDGDVYGDGVNVAARLEGLADPAGICVSSAVYQQVRQQVDASFEDLGLVEVKNIPTPVHPWKVVLDRAPPDPRVTATSTYTKPCVAVLPFDNLSGDQDQEYFADGITEDLITALSHHRDLRVVARNSTFVYKDRAGDVRKTARELDATHVVEGSIRRSGNRVRVTAQLIEAESGHHLWADRYDRELNDIFDLQDDIVHEIAGHIHPTVERTEGDKLHRSGPEELDVWDLALHARWYAFMNTRDGAEEAIRLLEIAAERDPSFGEAQAQLAMVWTTVAFSRWRIDDRDPWEEMDRRAREAYRLDPVAPGSIAVLGYAEVFAGNLGTAADLARRAVGKAPHDALVLNLIGLVELFRGDEEAAVEHLSNAWRLASHEPWRYVIANNLAFAHYLAGRYEAALVWAERGLEAGDYFQLRAIAAAALGQLGRSDEAAHHLAFVTASHPETTTGELLRDIRWEGQDDVAHYREGLIKAGLPE
jgi:adenylate cyclase